MSFEPGDIVRSKSTGVYDVVVSVPGMREYDSQDFYNSEEGLVSEHHGWNLQSNWEPARIHGVKVSSGKNSKRKGIMSYLKPVTTFIDSQKLPMKNYLRLGWVEVEDNDFVVTREGERADSFARIVLGITMAEHAASEVKRLEKESNK